MELAFLLQSHYFRVWLGIIFRKREEELPTHYCTLPIILGQLSVQLVFSLLANLVGEQPMA